MSHAPQTLLAAYRTDLLRQDQAIRQVPSDDGKTGFV